MEDRTKLGLAFVTGTAVVVGAAALLGRRRSGSTGGLGGAWSTSVEKLASGDDTAGKGVIVSWALPPGPTPSKTVEGTRGALRKICRKVGGKKALYAIQQESWKKVAKRLGVTVARAKEIEPKALDKLHAKVGEWWQYGTCPGCSEQCSRSCYVAKTASGYFGSQRQMWGNVCDVVEGKGLPEVREDSCETGSTRAADRPCGDKKVALAPREGDENSQDLVVNPEKVDAVYIRTHVSGDFFDVEYAKSWLDHARKSIARYKREYDAWQRGTRKHPPLRVHYWAYTRSWRLPSATNSSKPNPAMLDVIRTFPTLEYPEERWPSWAGEKAGTLRRGAKPTFAVLLSADSSTGIPWVKDKRGKIMPVSFVLTESDLTTVGEDGRPVVADWNKAVPGIVLRDHSLRKLSKSTGGAWESGKGEFWCPMEDPAKTPEQKEKIGGCYNCRLCLPGTVENVAKTMFKRYIKGWPDGEGFALMEAAKRGESLDWYAEWQKRGPTFLLAVPPVGTTFKRATKPNKQRMSFWQQWKLRRAPLIGE